MNTLEHFFNKTIESIEKDVFVKLTLSKPIRKAEGFLNVYARLILSPEEEPKLQFKYRYTDNYKLVDYTFEEAFKEIERLLSDTFRFGTLFSLEEDFIVTVSKSKLLNYRDSAPSFKNKLPEGPDTRK